MNVSPVELRSRRFVDGIAAALDAQRAASPDRLVLEITEGVMLRDPERSIATLHELRALGVQLALDDFGTGYSSLCHLRSLPIDWLKIGMPFMDNLEQGGSDRAFIRMVLDLATNLELDVVAEGIESAGQLASLRELGCEFGQGFYLGSPTTIDPVEVASRCTGHALATFAFVLFCGLLRPLEWRARRLLRAARWAPTAVERPSDASPDPASALPTSLNAIELALIAEYSLEMARAQRGRCGRRNQGARDTSKGVGGGGRLARPGTGISGACAARERAPHSPR